MNVSGINITDPRFMRAVSQNPKTGRLALVEEGGQREIKWFTKKELESRPSRHNIVLDIHEIAKALPELFATEAHGLEVEHRSALFAHCQWLQSELAKTPRGFLRTLFGGPRGQPSIASRLGDFAEQLEMAHFQHLYSKEQWDDLFALIRGAKHTQSAMVAQLFQNPDASFHLFRRCLEEGKELPGLAFKFVAYAPDKKEVLEKLPLSEALTLYRWIKDRDGIAGANQLIYGYTSQQQSFVQIQQGGSFLQNQQLDFSLSGTALSDPQWELLTALVASGHPQTLEELQLNQGFRSAVLRRLEEAPESVEMGALKNVLKEFEEYPSSFQAQGGFLKTLLFIEKNRGWMGNKEEVEKARKEGRVSSSRHHGSNVLKIKSGEGSGVPYAIGFDRSGKVLFLQTPLAKGGYKTVKKVLKLEPEEKGKSRILAVGKQSVELEMARKELQLTRECAGEPNVVELKSHTYKTKKGAAVLVTESSFYNEGSLATFLEKGGLQGLSQEDKLDLARDILKGVLAIHQRGIIHRDLKPENIFLKSEWNEETKKMEWSAAVADLGLACKRDDRKALKTLSGTLGYVQPELLLRHPEDAGPQNEQGDAWAVGMILYALHNGKGYYKTAIFADLNNFFNARTQYREQVVDVLNGTNAPSNGSLEHVIWKLMRPDPKERGTLTEAWKEVEALQRRAAPSGPEGG